MNINTDGILNELPNDGCITRTKIICTLGLASRLVSMIKKLLTVDVNVARFNFSMEAMNITGRP
ncbi:hypothetical protein J1N35_034900 [Gossypium stocksii]|uniref:Pyruvate kinase barrel domain-containing protein n=1 Tax=Gossypium stocksii TaxID=47602 RepID=A0A9D3USX1_9ROSI|nr:hypothetical protein J1N35_034900 [Gossypium stocksii]